MSCLLARLALHQLASLCLNIDCIWKWKFEVRKKKPMRKWLKPVFSGTTSRGRLAAEKNFLEKVSFYRSLLLTCWPSVRLPQRALPNMVTYGLKKTTSCAGQNAKLKATKWQFTNQWQTRVLHSYNLSLLIIYWLDLCGATGFNSMRKDRLFDRNFKAHL